MFKQLTEGGAATKFDGVQKRLASSSAEVIALAAIVMITVTLVFALPLGVGGDYPNHLARTYIEGWISESEDLAQYYDVAYGFIPDLTMDLTVPWLSHIFGIYGAGALLIAIAAVISPLAGFWLSRRLHGKRGAWLPLMGFMSVFSITFEYGFVNFLIATGFAIAAFALWTGIAPGWRRSLLFAPVGLFIVVNHALGFLLFGYLVLLWEGANFFHKERGGPVSFLRGLLTHDAAAFLPGLVFLCISVFSASDLNQTSNIIGAPWRERGIVALSAFLYYNAGASVLIAVAAFASLSTGLFIGLQRGVIEIDRRMAVVCAGLALLVALMPPHVLGIWGLHFRYTPVLVVLLAASIRFASGAEKKAGFAAATFAAVLAVQYGNGAMHMHRVDDVVTDLRGTLASLPKGARLLPVIDAGADARIAHHTPALSVIEADAYMPTLFTNTSPVDVTPAMQPLHLPAGLVPANILAEAAERDLPPSENGYWSRNFFFAWPEYFSYVLYMRVADGPGLSLPYLCTEKVHRDFVLYRVKSADIACAP